MLPARESMMDNWCCQVCGGIYKPRGGDDDKGIPPDTPFEQLPEEWVCPTCGATKANFRQAE